MNYQNFKKILFKFEPEIAHEIASYAMRTASFIPFVSNKIESEFTFSDEKLRQNLFGLSFPNPVGLGGGFDKNAILARALKMFGFGFLEVGTITPAPQSGNPKPRLFRLLDDKSIQNAMGFNNDGALKIATRLKNLSNFSLPIFANIGKNKITSNENAIRDYEFCARNLGEFCDAFTINISSPNTPNLRDLQTSEFIKEIANLKQITQKPLILKISPDMNEKEAIDLCIVAAKSGFSAVIVNNTSIDYSLSPNALNFGGISGELIKEKSRKLFEAVAKELFGKITLISCGGIGDASEAYERIKMGANLVQIYTAFIYEGPSICKNINQNLLNLALNDGFADISQAVGVDRK